MFPIITPPLLSRIWQCAEEAAPKEAVGMLYGEHTPTDGTAIEYTNMQKLANISNDPTRFFALDRKDFLSASKPRFSGKSLILWHSHVDALPKPSEEDMEVMWAIKLPMLIVSLNYKCAVIYSYNRPSSDGKRAVSEWGKWGKP